MEEELKKPDFVKVNYDSLKTLLAADSEEKFYSIKQIKSSTNIPNIQRLTIEEILSKYSVSLPHSDKKYTVCVEIEFDSEISFTESYDIPINPIIFIKSKFDSVKLKLSGNVSLPGIYFFECETGDIELSNCLKTQHITFDSCTEIKSLVISESKIHDLRINNSRVNYFQCSNFTCDTIKIFNKSELGNVVIQSDCRIISVDINGNKKVGDINFFKSHVDNFYLKNGDAGHNISRNSIFKHIVSSHSNTDEIVFLDETKVDELRASYFNIRDFKMRGKSEVRILSMKGGRVGEVHIEKESEVDYYFLSRSFTNNIAFKDSTINLFHVTNSITGSIKITKCSIGDIIINERSKTGDFGAQNSQISMVSGMNQYASFFLSDTKISLLKLYKCNIPRFNINKGIDIECHINEGKINHISFDKTCLGKDSVLSFSNTSIYALQIEEFAMLGNLFFRKINVLNKPFDWWSYNIKENMYCNTEKFEISLEQIKEEYLNRKKKLHTQFTQPTIRLSHSSLGKTEFTNCPLADFNFEFNNAKITECFISGGTVPSDNIIIIDDDGKPLENNQEQTHVQKASFYNQLKKVFDAQGDAYRAAQFQAKWAEHQKKTLKLEYGTLKREASFWKYPLKRLKLLIGELSQDIGIFRLNRWSNNHGESWLLALGFTVISTGILYVLFLWSIGRCFNANEVDWSLIGYYFEFLTPTFKPDFITGERPSSWSIGLYYVGKAVFAYGLYQFIAAFRKHGRKK